MKYLFEHHAKSPKDCNVLNPTTGNTILHVACIFPTDRGIRSLGINMALKHGIDPFVRNQNKKMAVDCFIIGDDPSKKVLQDEMAKATTAGESI